MTTTRSDRVFCPLVLYHEYPSSRLASSLQIYQSQQQFMIDRHRARMVERLEHNAQVWTSARALHGDTLKQDSEDDASTTSTASTVSDQHPPLHSHYRHERDFYTSHHTGFEQEQQQREQQRQLLDKQGRHEIDVSPSTSTSSASSASSSTSWSSSCDSIATVDAPPATISAVACATTTSKTAVQPAKEEHHHSPLAVHDLLSSPVDSPEHHSFYSSSAVDRYAYYTRDTPALDKSPHQQRILSKPAQDELLPKQQQHQQQQQTAEKKRRRGNLPKEVTEYLKSWLVEHKKHPYPSEKEKIQLANRTALSVNQISNWFINARRRILQPMLESENLNAQLVAYSREMASIEQKKRRQLDIYAYQGFAESYEDESRKWAFRRTKLPAFELHSLPCLRSIPYS
ncbi:hypothetical protein BCR43DRAFT_525880 [Syncephalastrum racemosum]|uniref:Homeobox domain-containing protein n=1 Tax=Syncephalastrum racemosum TaxID=13706 RepID=A0A1X2H880_SYNRA|nr:hypothetical protein BCR43DRAFT_525880 [Syncephalastrum racemosum]